MGPEIFWLVNGSHGNCTDSPV